MVLSRLREHRDRAGVVVGDHHDDPGAEDREQRPELSQAPGQDSKPQILAPPTVAVAVLNAGPISQAAHRLALDLARHRVHVVGIGNLGAAAPAEYEILYTPGEAGRARLLAGILTAQRPRVAPTDRHDAPSKRDDQPAHKHLTTQATDRRQPTAQAPPPPSSGPIDFRRLGPPEQVGPGGNPERFSIPMAQRTLFGVHVAAARRYFFRRSKPAWATAVRASWSRQVGSRPARAISR